MMMMMAALIAAVGLIAGLPMAIVGAMAFSPDLGRLNVMGFAILFREVRLFLRGLVATYLKMKTGVRGTLGRPTRALMGRGR